MYESRHGKFLEKKVYKKIKTGCKEIASKQEMSSTNKINKSKQKEALSQCRDQREDLSQTVSQSPM